MKKAITKRRSGRIGSSFDEFLKEEAIYEGVTARAIKRVLARQLDELMRREDRACHTHENEPHTAQPTA